MNEVKYEMLENRGQTESPSQRHRTRNVLSSQRIELEFQHQYKLVHRTNAAAEVVQGKFYIRRYSSMDERS